MVRKQKHPRKSTSCTECRRQRKKCVGGIPGCQYCQERGIVHLCCWGDERDLIEGRRGSASLNADELGRSRASNSLAHDHNVVTPSPAKGILYTDPVSPANVDLARIELMNVLAEEDAKASRHTDASLSFGSASAVQEARHQIESWRLPTYPQATELLTQHRNHLSMSGLHTVDYDAVEAAYDRRTGLVDSKKSYDIISLLLFVCASALSVIPATYSITLGLVKRSEEIEELGDLWISAGWKALEESDQYSTPSLEGVQAIIVYQYNLSTRGSRYAVVNSLDQGIRTARQLGLDRLGSYESDEHIWAREGDVPSEPNLIAAKEKTSGWWAAKTLRMRDWKAREFARCQWMLLLCRDWAASRQMGTHSIHPDSFTTRPPKVYLHKSLFSTERVEVWPFLSESAQVLQCFGDLCIDANVSSGKLSYDSILLLDAQMTSLLERRPPWMRAEANGIDTSGNVLVDAAGNITNSSTISAFLACNFWQRLYVLHRPFLALSISDPQTYGLSAQRTFDNAMLFLKTCKHKVAEGMYSINQSILMIHLHQAALVIITHLLLSNLNKRIGGNGDTEHCYLNRFRSAAETVEIHTYLNFAISILKTSRQAARTMTTTKTIDGLQRLRGKELLFEGVGERLESLLASCAKLGNINNAETIDNTGAVNHLDNKQQLPDQLASLDARLQQIADLTSWPPDDADQSDWLTMNDADWQQVLQNLS